MAEAAEQLVVSLEARIREFERNFQRANRVANDNWQSIEKRSRAGARNIEQAMANSTGAMSRQLENFGTAAAGKLKGAFAAIAAGVGLNELRKVADDYTKIMNSLKVAGVKDADLSGTFDKLFASAQRNYAPLDALATLYGRVSAAQTTLKASSDDVMRVTDITAQALRVGGTSAKEASGALLQLGQALAGGKLQAEEYNSLLDGMRPLLQAAASGMVEAGGDVAKLTALVKDGKVSSEAFFRAILAGAPVLEDKLAGATTTTEQAFQRLQNELTKAVGEFDRVVGVSPAVVSGMESVANSIGPIGAAAADATVKVQGLLKALSDVMAASGKAITGALESAQADTAKTQRTILEAKLRGAIGPERAGIEAQLRALDAGAQNPSAKAARDAADRDRYIAAGKDIGDLTTQGTAIGVRNAPLPPSRPAGVGGNGVKPISLADYKVPGDDKGGGGGASGAEKLSRYDREIQAIQRRTEALKLEADMVGKGREEVERSKIALQLEQAAKRDGITVTDEMRTAIDNAAQGYAAAKMKVEDLKASLDGVRDAQKFFAQEVTDGFVDMIVEGKSATEVIQGLAKALLKAALQAALMGSGPLAGLFGTAGKDGAVGGLFGALFKGVSFGLTPGSGGLYANGGYTGAGSKWQPAGVVHAGEVVWSQADIRRAGGVATVEAMRRGLRGYADGGYVGSAPSIRQPDLASASAAPVQSISISAPVTVNANGGTPEANADLAKKISREMEVTMRSVIAAEITKQTRPGNFLNTRSR